MIDLTQHSDDQLVMLFQKGGSRAFDILVDRYHAQLHRFLLQRVGDTFLADDLMQEAFLKVLDTIRSGRYHAEGKFKPFLFRIAQNLAIDYFRAAKRQPSLCIIEDDSWRDSFFDRLPSPTLNMQEELEKATEQRALRYSVAQLPKSQRDVVIMRYAQELSFKEIADITGVGINTALGRMRYALLNLRKNIHPSVLP